LLFAGIARENISAGAVLYTQRFNGSSSDLTLNGGVSRITFRGAPVVSPVIVTSEVRNSKAPITENLSNGLVVSVNPASIGDDVTNLNFNVGIQFTNKAERIDNEVIPANSIVIDPMIKGEFGFEMEINIPKDALNESGIKGNNLNVLYIAHDGTVQSHGKVKLNKDGSVTIVIDRASSYALVGIQIGDINGDGKVDIMDALEILKYLVGMNGSIDGCAIAKIASLTTEASEETGEPTIMDALEILKFLVAMDSRVYLDNDDVSVKSDKGEKNKSKDDDEDNDKADAEAS
jgi:hypothetical protein